MKTLIENGDVLISHNLFDDSSVEITPDSVNLRRTHRTSRMVIDTRNVALRQLSEDFVEAAEVAPSTLPSNEIAQPRAQKKSQ